MTMENINSLEQVFDVLEALGYEPTLSESAIAVPIGGFNAIVTINDINLTISLQLLTLGQINEQLLPAVMTAALDANTRILPFAFATITASDNDELSEPSTFPLVLTDSLPVGDISTSEIESAFVSLRTALIGSRNVLELALSTPEPIPGRRGSGRGLIGTSSISRGRLARLGGSFGSGLNIEDLIEMLFLAEILFDDGEFLADDSDSFLEEEAVGAIVEGIDAINEAGIDFDAPAPAPVSESFEDTTERFSGGSDSFSSPSDSGGSYDSGGGGSGGGGGDF